MSLLPQWARPPWRDSAFGDLPSVVPGQQSRQSGVAGLLVGGVPSGERDLGASLVVIGGTLDVAEDSDRGLVDDDAVVQVGQLV